MCYGECDIDESSEVSELGTTESNVRKDLSEWQERHATLVLGSVKVYTLRISLVLHVQDVDFVFEVWVLCLCCLQQISKLRYELCPRVMKERRFWRIYFTLVSTHVAP